MHCSFGSATAVDAERLWLMITPETPAAQYHEASLWADAAAIMLGKSWY